MNDGRSRMIDDEQGPHYADARRVLLATMREVQTVSDRLADLVEPWSTINVMGDFVSEA
jgi:hypothetical protein